MAIVETKKKILWLVWLARHAEEAAVKKTNFSQRSDPPQMGATTSKPAGSVAPGGV